MKLVINEKVVSIVKEDIRSISNILENVQKQENDNITLLRELSIPDVPPEKRTP